MVRPTDSTRAVPACVACLARGDASIGIHCGPRETQSTHRERREPRYDTLYACDASAQRSGRSVWPHERYCY